MEFGAASKMEFESEFEFLFEPGLELTFELEFEFEFDFEFNFELDQVRVRVRGRAFELEFELVSSSFHLPAFLRSVKETTAAREKTDAELNLHLNFVRKLPFRNPKLVSK